MGRRRPGNYERRQRPVDLEEVMSISLTRFVQSTVALSMLVTMAAADITNINNVLTPAAAASGGFFIQSRYGTKGNFELVVPLPGSGVAHFWRDNDAPGMPWKGPEIFAREVGHV